MDNSVRSHAVNLILVNLFQWRRSHELFLRFWLLHLSTYVYLCMCVCVIWTHFIFTLFPADRREMKCLPSLAAAAVSQPMCWLQGPAHIHMFPVCLAQQDTGWIHALLIIPTTQTLQGLKPNSIFQHTLVNIMVSTALVMWYYWRGRQTVQSAVCHQLWLWKKVRALQLVIVKFYLPELGCKDLVHYWLFCC